MGSTFPVPQLGVKIYFPHVVLKNSIRNLAEGIRALVPFHPSPSARAKNSALELETHLPLRCVMYYYETERNSEGDFPAWVLIGLSVEFAARMWKSASHTLRWKILHTQRSNRCFCSRLRLRLQIRYSSRKLTIQKVPSAKNFAQYSPLSHTFHNTENTMFKCTSKSF